MCTSRIKCKIRIETTKVKGFDTTIQTVFAAILNTNYTPPVSHDLKFSWNLENITQLSQFYLTKVWNHNMESWSSTIFDYLRKWDRSIDPAKTCSDNNFCFLNFCEIETVKVRWNLQPILHQSAFHSICVLGSWEKIHCLTF